MDNRIDTLKGIKFFIHTFGCQMNENDSERIAGLLAAAGARKSDSAEDSGVIIINTCAVRAKSEEKLYSYLGRLLPLKKTNGAVIGVAGCIGQLYRTELLAKKPFLDFICGPDHYQELPEILVRCLGEKVVSTGWSRSWKETPPRSILHESPVSAYVTIMEGCDHFCAYCVVPFTRGREKFRPFGNILEEIRDLAGRGYKEIQLLGQNVNSYRDPETGMAFSEVLKEIDGTEGVEWIRFITSHPRNLTPDIAEAMRQSKKVCRQLHLPLQSGASSVLDRMNRGYGREDYLDKVRLLRNLMPEISLSTDIIVGFPGETEKEFEETLTALQEIRFASIFSFRYSLRPRTTASRVKDDIPFDVKRRRLLEVQSLQKRIQSEIHKGYLGQTLKVLCLGKSKKDGPAYSGRNEGFQVVNFTSNQDLIGRFVHVLITSWGPYSLRGESQGPA
jgi:tRNA-2-methylthio-N6-dimethylallyladenosine synthase